MSKIGLGAKPGTPWFMPLSNFSGQKVISDVIAVALCTRRGCSRVPAFTFMPEDLMNRHAIFSLPSLISGRYRPY